MKKQLNEFILYTSLSGEIRVDVLLENETVWLTQKAMAELFQTSTQNITIHLKNIYESGELQEHGTCKAYLQVQIEGKRKVERKHKLQWMCVARARERERERERYYTINCVDERQ